MAFLTIAGSSNNTWQPTMGADTTTPSYWLNWRFFICAVFVLIAMVLASFLIWKYEEFNKPRSERRRRRQQETAGSLYKDEAWNTCVKGIHPAWLLAYRTISFLVLLSLIIANVVSDGGGIFYFYTQLNDAIKLTYSFIPAPSRKQFSLSSTFPIYVFTSYPLTDFCSQFHFQLGCCFSIYGYYFNKNSCCSNLIDHASLDSEQGTYVAPTLDATADVSNLYKSTGAYQEHHTRDAADVWGYIFQIIFQTCAGAVVLTDCVFWLIIYPFLMSKDFSLDFLVVCMHSINALFLLGDTTLNCMVLSCGCASYSMLWHLCFNSEVEALVAVKSISRVLSVCKWRQIFVFTIDIGSIMGLLC
uniref:Uncharacterized protein n=1 Tax=Lupinus angustifolius TaxID=3871 RepID=A0A182BFB3_LUPAN|nr:hypothetical protein [Lupinus angustifolius]